MTGKDRQTVADVALTVAGSAEAMFLLARESGVRLDSDVSGVKLADVAVEDKHVVEYYARNGIVPANIFPADDPSDDSIENDTEEEPSTDDTPEDDNEDDTNEPE